MELKEDQVKNWFVKFGVLKRDQDWHQIHVSGHGDGEQIKYVVEPSAGFTSIKSCNLKSEQ